MQYRIWVSSRSYEYLYIVVEFHEIQHGADQATPNIRRETNYVEQDESEEIENQNMGPQGLTDEE